MSVNLLQRYFDALFLQLRLVDHLVANVLDAREEIMNAQEEVLNAREQELSARGTRPRPRKEQNDERLELWRERRDISRRQLRYWAAHIPDASVRKRAAEMTRIAIQSSESTSPSEMGPQIAPKR